jgi:polyhydroxyalkanoate synthesis repressor PhaR
MAFIAGEGMAERGRCQSIFVHRNTDVPMLRCAATTMAEPIIIKKYSNRRLYDTYQSRYITLDELEATIRDGTDVRVVDAKSGDDLTQPTLTQIIVEGRGAAHLLPVPLLLQLIRLGDDALAEFFGRYVTGALDLYLQARRGAQAIAPYNPLANLPFAAGDALARMWMATPFGRSPDATPPPAPAPERSGDEQRDDDVASLRRELEELKKAVKGSAPKRRRRPKSKSES